MFIAVWKTPVPVTHMVTRVTSKKIYVRQYDRPNEFYCSRETGKCHKCDYILDVEATMAEWERYRATNGTSKD